MATPVFRSISPRMPSALAATACHFCFALHPPILIQRPGGLDQPQDAPTLVRATGGGYIGLEFSAGGWGRQDRGDALPVHKAVVSAAIGLHARPAAEFVRAVTATGLPVSIRKA